MKILLSIILFALLFVLAGCTTGIDEYAASVYSNQNSNEYYEDVNSDVLYQEYNGAADYILEITDPDFASQIKEIQFFRDEFLGRTIRFEGMFLSSYWEDEAIYFVARLEGGCCGFPGFEVYLNDITRFDDETWVEVTGILEEFFVEGDDRYFLRLNVISLLEREEP